MDTFPAPRALDTIVFIHGMWVTSLSWERWVDRYTTLGYRVLAPDWPRMDGGVFALRANPAVMDRLGIEEIADHYEQIIRRLELPPIIVGHALGGTVAQILLDRGLGAAGVALHSAPVRGVHQFPRSSLRSTLPLLLHPATRHRTLALSPAQFHYAFANTVSEPESRTLYHRYHVPSPGRPLWQAITANLAADPPTRVNVRNDERAPLLFVGSDADHVTPASLVRGNVRRYAHSDALTEYRETPHRPHLTLAVPGWEDVADDVLEWALRNRRVPTRTPVIW